MGGPNNSRVTRIRYGYVPQHIDLTIEVGGRGVISKWDSYSKEGYVLVVALPLVRRRVTWSGQGTHHRHRLFRPRTIVGEPNDSRVRRIRYGYVTQHIDLTISKRIRIIGAGWGHFLVPTQTLDRLSWAILGEPNDIRIVKRSLHVAKPPLSVRLLAECHRPHVSWSFPLPPTTYHSLNVSLFRFFAHRNTAV